MKIEVGKEYEPVIGSIWMDREGNDTLYKYKGISHDETFLGQLHFVAVDFKTGKEHEGGLWLGRQRFQEDMVPLKELSVQPCCGHPTQYPSVWCDDCGYEKWEAAITPALQTHCVEGEGLND